MLSFFGRESMGKPACVVDVESASCGAAIVLHAEEGTRVLAAERVSLPVGERTSEQTIVAIPGIVHDAVERALKKYGESDSSRKSGPVKAIHAIIGAPWVNSRTEHVETTFDKDTSVTGTVIQGLARDALQKQVERRGRTVFETSVIRVQLNGYGTAKPLGKRAKHVAVTAFESDIEPRIQQGIQTSLGSLLPGRPIDMRSQLRALLGVLHELSDTRQHLVISVGSESTLCIAIRKDEIAEHKDVNEGTATVVRRIAGEKGLPEETLSLMRMLVEGTCSSDACENIKVGLGKAEPELMKTFGDAFSVLASVRRLPNSCALVAHADFAPWLEHFFSRLDFSPFTMTTQPLLVESITPNHLEKLVSWEPDLRADTGLSIAAAFVGLNAAKK